MAKAKSSLMDEMMDEIEAPAPKKAGAKKKDRPTIRCETPEEIEVLDSFAATYQILKVAEGAEKATKGRAYEVFQDRLLRLFVRLGCKCENPSVTSPNSRANIVVKHMSRFNRTGPDGEVLDVAKQLADMGFGPAVVAKVNEVLKEKVVFGLRPFTELTDEEAPKESHQLADKLLKLVRKNFTPAQRKILMQKSITTEVDRGWQKVAIEIACASVDKEDDEYEFKAADVLRKLFSVISPQIVMSQLNFTGELSSAFDQIKVQTPAGRAAAEKSAEKTDGKVPPPKIVVPVFKKEIASANNRYTAKIVDNKVTLFLVKPDGGEEEKGTKICDNAGHAEATAKKWFRNPEYLAEFLADCKSGRTMPTENDDD